MFSTTYLQCINYGELYENKNINNSKLLKLVYKKTEWDFKKNVADGGS
ncbi:hypothetical protein P20480_3194 [Pseudoalteromonas sp. BSi20480]|jgi:hypothetical protein|nr:hypothetical protein P20480_3194 [Pseudoalteromonas sp. BSi20480]|tara:strand:+ start:1276 stop:1419 length:144 start_codon:yes stop_codon:yes gene_type:complete